MAFVSVVTSAKLVTKYKIFLLQLDATAGSNVEICNRGYGYIYNCDAYPSYRRSFTIKLGRVGYPSIIKSHAFTFPHPLIAYTSPNHVCVPAEVIVEADLHLDLPSDGGRASTSTYWGAPFYNRKVNYTVKVFLTYPISATQYATTQIGNTVSDYLQEEPSPQGKAVYLSLDLSPSNTFVCQEFCVRFYPNHDESVCFKTYNETPPLVGVWTYLQEIPFGLAVTSSNRLVLTYTTTNPPLGIIKSGLSQYFSLPDDVWIPPEDICYTLPSSQEIIVSADRAAVWNYHTFYNFPTYGLAPALCGFKSVSVVFYLGHPMFWKSTIRVQDDFGRNWKWVYSRTFLEETYVNPQYTYLWTGVKRTLIVNNVVKEETTAAKQLGFALPSPASHYAGARVKRNQVAVLDAKF